MRHQLVLCLLLAASAVFVGCSSHASIAAVETATPIDVTPGPIKNIVSGALEQTKTTREYTQDYFEIAYPNGDVPANTGACTDVVIRGFRSAGVDLQKEVHEDMKANFAAYPNKWGLSKTDPNIDHRRVPNLQTYFTRKGKSLPISRNAEEYKPGDVVSWDINGRGMTHIGLVSNLRSERTGRYLVIHNIGAGVNAEDRLFDWTITGHYRYF